MSKLHVNHIKSYLNSNFKDQIDDSDIVSKEEAHEKNLLSRALSAYALTVQASCDIKTACKHITDGYNDNGIDLIYFDRKNKNLWLIQSKYIDSGTGGISNGDILKFITGIKNLVDLKFGKFNSKVVSLQNDITEALNDPFVKIQIVLAYTGNQLSDHNKEVINDFLKEINDTSEIAFFTDFNLAKAHNGLINGLDGNPVNVDITLSNWGQIETPFHSIYGQISGCDLARWWKNYGRKLFSENIRSFLGVSEVNEDIIDTIKNNPENFIYFNNGITVLCNKIIKKPVGGSDKTIGAFYCEGISIVNGAQTLGAIGTYFDSKDNFDSPLKVLIKIISLENVPEGMAEKITIATNTQNKIDKKDFISLDNEQERLKTDFLLENINYHYKRSDEKVPQDSKNYTLEEATVSLAAFSEDVSLSVQAKREIGKLWEDRNKKPYTELFNADLSALRLSRTILIYRVVIEFLKVLISKTSGRERGIYIYGNLFIAHIIFQKINRYNLDDPQLDFENYLSQIKETIVPKVVKEVYEKVEELYPNSMIPQLFRNFTKCRDIESGLIH